MLLNGFLRFERATTRTALMFAVAFLAFAASLAFYQVITRYLFDAPSTWSAVATRTFIIWSVFLGAAHAFRTDGMMRVEVVYSLLPARFHPWLEALIALLCLVFFLLLAYFGTRMGMRVSQQTLAGMDISIAWAYAALPVGSTFACVAIIGRYCDRFMTSNAPVAVPRPQETCP